MHAETLANTLADKLSKIKAKTLANTLSHVNSRALLYTMAYTLPELHVKQNEDTLCDVKGLPPVDVLAYMLACKKKNRHMPRNSQ